MIWIRAANKYVIDNWQSLVKLAKKNNLEDMDNLLDQYRQDFFETRYFNYMERSREYA